ncbi:MULTISPECIES: hypothetical protein [Enterobacteriaceae]|uniref:hypothetical protein n=1 Tax=Enterobacteriaceae TaxID=543 RepID=UPI00073533C8|nr:MULTISPECIES: hypothetical protein [Enterobacteriaceae]EBO5316285.1 hypothetical protein [Salmonella enterica]MDU7219462.1 hypothetical protein [Citrobacter freundii]EFL6466942.1 hypothetical protein [Escherichia coli]EFN8929738.1 hypothetical protein [Escherichia coli]EGX9517794.1 hypothetical protein [Salmonella enterica]
MKTILDVIGFLLAVSAYDWMRTNVPAKRRAAWIAAAATLFAWICVQAVGEALFEMLPQWVW